jgi:plastocyanin
MRARAARWWLGAVLLALPLAGCGGQAERPSVSVGMFDNFYARDVTRVPAGTPVVFENKGYAPHNAVAVTGAFRTQQSIDAEESATVVASLPPGVYRYYCTFQATPDASDGMVATLVVGDVPFDPGTAEQGSGLAAVSEVSGVTRRVPEDHRTIQAAVDAPKAVTKHPPPPPAPPPPPQARRPGPDRPRRLPRGGEGPHPVAGDPRPRPQHGDHRRRVPPGQRRQHHRRRRRGGEPHRAQRQGQRPVLDRRHRLPSLLRHRHQQRGLELNVFSSEVRRAGMPASSIG